MQMWLFVLTMLSAGGRVLCSSSCITRDLFGSYHVPELGGQETPVYRYTLTNGQVSVRVMEYGATITSITAPDRRGQLDDIVLGFDTLEEYFSSNNPYFGATLGRVANRIARGTFTVDGTTYQLYRNDGNHTLHSGLRTFDKKLWSSSMQEGRVVMQYTSPDGEEGFPGVVTATVAYSLTPDNTLVIEYHASSSKLTPINLSNHAYYNLAGQSAEAVALYDHIVTIRADHVTEVDSEFIPTGQLLPVGATEFDLRLPRNLGEAIKRTAIDGFDNNYVLPKDREVDPVAVVEHPSSGRRVEVVTSQPGLQFYTSNSITNINGKGGHVYRRHAAFCLEAQNFPDAVNHPDVFPKSVYGPGDDYHQVARYKFSVKPASNAA